MSRPPPMDPVMNNWKYLLDACAALQFPPDNPDRIAGVLEALSYAVEERPDGGAASMTLLRQSRSLQRDGTIIPPPVPEKDEDYDDDGYEEDYDDDDDDDDGYDEGSKEDGSFEGLVLNLRWLARQIQTPVSGS